ncbi:helix-turn-helix domain-containing protein [Streptomyces odontomachi]|uniref:helix-turn-helix domain-containing protein n=1 Tax=Streptomyces odontomachi TaxID=2944940 RepID=UPI00210C62BC|nr:helix-turn-helix transcriptional regulator [Streptomyces sp. ODS25]
MRHRILEGPLAPEQLAALRLAASGYSSRQIAARLGATESAIHQRLNQMARTVGARSRAHLVAIALCRGLIRAADVDLPAIGDIAAFERQGVVAASGDIARQGSQRCSRSPLSAFEASRVPQEHQAPERASGARVAPLDGPDAPGAESAALRRRVTQAIRDTPARYPDDIADAVVRAIGPELAGTAVALIRHLEATLAAIREYAETTDDDGIRTRETVLRLLDRPAPADETPAETAAADRRYWTTRYDTPTA